jgi:very-short-patch-repair endonuclease
MNEITFRARQLRKVQTQAESMLWECLRSSKTGFRIVRQKPISFQYQGKSRTFFADYYCKEAQVIIEVDGVIHLQQEDYDQLRTELLSVMQIEVIRFTNEEVFDDILKVIDSIISFLRRRREDVAKRQERGS